MRKRLKELFDRHSHLLGRQLLGVEEMTSRYPQFCHPCADMYELQTFPALDIDGRGCAELMGGQLRYSATFVYRLSAGAVRRLEVLANGGILIDKKIIPNTGVGNQRASILASIQPTFRKSRQEAIIVAPWPHYMGVSYGDFMLFVLPRICRVINHLTLEEKRRAVIAYPLANAPWETDLLGKLGFQPGQLVDTRVCKIEPTPSGIVCAPSGEDLAWVGCAAHPADYENARKALWKGPSAGHPPSRRLYLQRNVGRRILNEQELLKMLKPHGFETVDMGQHSISDQMAMLADSRVILGAQGANMNSMIWLPRGAAVVEFFNRGFRPAYNLRMAKNIGLDYHFLSELPMLPHDFSHLNLDLQVDTEAVAKFLAKLLP